MHMAPAGPNGTAPHLGGTSQLNSLQQKSAYRESIATQSYVLRLAMRRLAMYGRDSRDDVLLICRIAARDTAAFAPLYDRYASHAQARAS